MNIAEILTPVAVTSPGAAATSVAGPGFAAALSAALPAAMPDDAGPRLVSADPAGDEAGQEGAEPAILVLASVTLGVVPSDPAPRKLPGRPSIPRIAAVPADGAAQPTAVVPAPSMLPTVREPVEALRSDLQLSPGRPAAVSRRAALALPMLPTPTAVPVAGLVIAPAIRTVAVAGPHNSLSAATPALPAEEPQLPPTVGPTVGIPVPLASAELQLPPTIGPTVGIPLPLGSPPAVTGPVTAAPVTPPAYPGAPMAPADARTPPRRRDRSDDAPVSAVARGAAPRIVTTLPPVADVRSPAALDGVTRDRATAHGHEAALSRLPDAPLLAAVPPPALASPPAFAPPPGNAPPVSSDAAATATPADTARARDAAALTVTTPALGDVRIALDGGPQDLRVALAMGAGGAALVSADVARLGSDLAAQGLRLQSLDVGGGGADAGGGSHGEPRRPVPARLFAAAAADRTATNDRYA